jgi:hypothetical protein
MATSVHPSFTITVKGSVSEHDGVGGRREGMQYQVTHLFASLIFCASGKSDTKSLGVRERQGTAGWDLDKLGQEKKQLSREISLTHKFDSKFEHNM